MGGTLIAAGAATPQVLRVGTFAGKPGTFTTIQAAVSAAQPGDWILVAPGDYHESGSSSAGVLVTKPGIHIRGMNRDGVVVDGTRPGFGRCASTPTAQYPTTTSRNGIEVLKVSGVSIENLTVCNFLAGSTGHGGNEIWWNGGDGSGTIGLGAFHGAYLTASSSFFVNGDPRVAMYGVFVSNSDGPGVIAHAYASNMADSSFYVGACRDCNATLTQVHAENSALGYSGSNAGGHLQIVHSEWDGNRAGIVPNSLANDDPPSPQNGSCPSAPANPCTFIEFNWVHGNNNPNTPAVGLTAGAPVGTGIEISGGRNDTVQNNFVTNQGGWGILVHDYPDASAPSVPTYCQGGLKNYSFPPLGKVCYFVGFGNHVMANTFADNGGFANPTNSDLADATIVKPLGPDGNCFDTNVDLKTTQPSSDPANIQSPSVLGVCGSSHAGDTTKLIDQLFCAAYYFCPAGGTYPKPAAVHLLPIPFNAAAMPNPCEGIPANPWCA